MARSKTTPNPFYRLVTQNGNKGDFNTLEEAVKHGKAECAPWLEFNKSFSKEYLKKHIWYAVDKIERVCDSRK
jgi:hypothetical protein